MSLESSTVQKDLILKILFIAFTYDVGYPYICCEYVLLPLVNKEAALVYGRAEYSKAGIPSRDKEGKEAE